jgi:hypothetical protein
MVDEDSPDDDTTYLFADSALVSGSPPIGSSEYEIQNLPNGVSHVSGVSVFTRAKKTDSSDVEIFTSIISDVNSISGSPHDLAETYGYHTDLYEYDPFTIANFTRDGFNLSLMSISAQFGEGGGSPVESPIPEFDPSDLFALGEIGIWYDPSDLSTLWQDTAGTVPITTDGQAVARIDDKSGNGVNATQSTTSKRPLYKTDGSKHWLQFDGSNDNLVTGNVNFSGIDEISIFSGMTYTGASIMIFFEPTSQGWQLAKDTTDYLFRSNGTVFPVIAKYTITNNPNPSEWTMTAGISDDSIIGRLDQSEVTSSTADQGFGNYDNDPVYIGARTGSSLFWNGKLFGVIVRGKLSSSQEIADAESYMAGKV